MHFQDPTIPIRSPFGTCGILCEPSKHFEDVEDTTIVLARFPTVAIPRMLDPDGMEFHAKRLFMKMRDDKTVDIHYETADEIDAISNHRFQKVLFAAYDLLTACERTDESLPDDVVVAMHEMKQRLRDAATSNT